MTLRLCLRMLGGDSWVGGAYYIQNLIRCVASLPETERRTVHLTLEAGAGANDYAAPVRPLVNRVRHVSTVGATMELGARVLNRRYPALGRWHHPYDLVFPCNATGKTLSSGAAWIPDFQHRYLPNLFSRLEIENRERRNLEYAINAFRVVLSSRMAFDDFVRLYPFARDKATILNFASVIEPDWLSEDTGALSKYGLPSRFFLVSNKFWVHKNHGLVLEALRAIPERTELPPVVFTGATDDHRNPTHFPSFQENIRTWRLHERVRILGHIPRIDQIQLLRHCLALIQPSRFEGWSTVIEDARALGKPVLMSDFAVHLEQSPPHSQVFPQADASELARLMLAASEVHAGYDAEREALALKASLANNQRVGRELIQLALEGRHAH